MHRLDRDTSGALVCGRNGVATTSLSNQFKASGVVRKRYVALCAVTDAFEEEETREEYRVVTGHGRAKFGLFRLYRLEDVDRELPGKSRVKRCETTIIIERRDDGAVLAECRPVTGANPSNSVTRRESRASARRRRAIRRTPRISGRRRARRAASRGDDRF